MDDRELRYHTLNFILCTQEHWKTDSGLRNINGAISNLGERLLTELKAREVREATEEQADLKLGLSSTTKERRMQPPSIGRIVHYVTIGDTFGTLLKGGLIRAATVVNVGRHLGGDAPLEGNRVNLQVLTDGTNDWVDSRSRSPDDPVQHVELTRWVTNIEYDEADRPGTWHWPPQVKPETRGELSAVMGGVKLDE